MGNIYFGKHENSGGNILKINMLSPDGTIKNLATHHLTRAELRNKKTPMCLDHEENLTFVKGNQIFKLVDGKIITFAGAHHGGYFDGDGEVAAFRMPCSLCSTPDGTIVIVDSDNFQIRTVSPTAKVTTLAGRGEADIQDGPHNTAAFGSPMGATYHDCQIYVSDNDQIRAVSMDANMPWVSTIYRLPENPELCEGVAELRFDHCDNLIILTDDITVDSMFDLSGGWQISSALVRISSDWKEKFVISKSYNSLMVGLCIDQGGNIFFIRDHKLTKITVGTSQIPPLFQFFDQEFDFSCLNSFILRSDSTKSNTQPDHRKITRIIK